MKKQIKLSRIHCAGCAEALEQKINEIEEVEAASIDFTSRIVNYKTECKDIAAVEENIVNVIRTFDSSIKIIDTSEEEKAHLREKREMIWNILRIILSVIIAIGAVFIPKTVLWLQISMFVVSYMLVAYDVLWSALKNFFHGRMLDENFLMSIATIGAFAIGEYVEAIAVMLFYTIGELLEGLAVEKSKKRIKSLLEIKPKTANLIINGDELALNIEDVKEGSIIRIKAGEMIPLDCLIIEGESYLNTAAITGESKELFVKAGDEVLSGSINGEGLLHARVLKEDKNSTVSKIIELVENANKSKAKTEKFITKFAKIYTPIVVGIAVLLAAIPPLCGLPFKEWLYTALNFLVISCPCALVLSIPLGYFAGLGSAARNGVLIKGATYLELLAKAKTVIFDKTGTLTKGDFEVSEIHAEECSSNDEVLELIAYAESFSNHRIAKSIVKAYSKTINTAWVEDYKEVAGKGIIATLFNEQCLVGNAELLSENGIKFKETDSIGTVVYIAKSGVYLGYIIIVDAIKEDARDTILSLKNNKKLKTVMLTGDNDIVARAVGENLGIEEVYAGLLPEEKLKKVGEIEKQNPSIFVGDGINDAPALATASVGVSMGGIGSDAAIETADAILMTDEPKKLLIAIDIAQKTRNIIYENLVFILVVKLVVMVLSVLHISTMWLAIFADVGVCLLAVLNSLRALRINVRKKKNAKCAPKTQKIPKKWHK